MKLSEKAQAALDRVVEKMKTGDLSPVIDVALIRLPKNAAFPAAKWTFSNRLLAYLQTGDLDCRGYRQWESAGRQVTKGQRAAYILAPRMIKQEDAKGDEESKCVGFLAVPVFGISQTEGDQIEELSLAPKEPPPLLEVAARFGISVKYLPAGEEARGYYDPARKSITLCTHHEKTFFHELAHAAHDRLESLKGGQDARQETIAEFTACVLAAMYGKDYSGNSWEYIQSYNNNPLTAIMAAMETIEKVIALIFTVPVSYREEEK